MQTKSAFISATKIMKLSSFLYYASVIVFYGNTSSFILFEILNPTVEK